MPSCLQIGGSPDLYPERNGVKADPEFEQFYESEAQAVFSAVFLLCRSKVEAGFVGRRRRLGQGIEAAPQPRY